MSQDPLASTRPTAMLRVALVLSLFFAPSLAAAQSDVLVVSGESEPANGRALRQWVSAIRRETHAAHVRLLHEGDCAPERDPACATRFMRSSDAQRIVLVRVFYERAGCVPDHGGHRMLRSTVVDVLVLDAQGQTIAHETRPAELPDPERPAAATALVHALGALKERRSIDASQPAGRTPARAAISRARVTKMPDKIGRYEIIRLLGQGAMGAVHLGRDPSLDREVAIKTLKEIDLPDDAKKRFLERFRNEARAAARLHDPTIVQVFDVGEDPAAGGPFLVLEYVKGTTLKHLLREKGPLSPEDLVDVARQIAHAIDLAHAREIIHRDVKPDNILVAEDGRAKLADFGVARLPDAALTKEGQFLGTPCYAAPETLTAGKYGPRTDLFSFAAVLYELASGARAFPGDDAISVAHAVIHDTPAIPSKAGSANVPAQLDAVIMRGLDKNAEARFASAQELAEAVEQAYVDAGLLAPLSGERSNGAVTPRAGLGRGAFVGMLVVGLVVLSGAVAFFGNDGALFGTAMIDGDASLPDGAVESDAGRPRAHDAGPGDAGVQDDAGNDAWSEPDTNVAAPPAALSRQEREDMAKDELDAARAAVEHGAIDDARSHLSRARELDPESSDIEEIEALIASHG